MAQKHPLVIARERCNLTQAQFATKVGLSVKTIWKAEHNQKIGAYSRGKICKYLKLTAEELGLVLGQLHRGHFTLQIGKPPDRNRDSLERQGLS
ncbi:hypothetical protein KSC_017190 [Ktedonobacter sp. SOSP1-52]|uniref:helix-turn-helix domain-containing protein n=1 Tax=Ktedonobacter sp. SOSP1-52 TaxID=2778366 RepID=UPI001915372C|nr:helix-turn-helix transcriptional regulator [Ktedonobacter sp. SOSP1-52]GHO62827.1 hypothetical protein KSC_017190 [Ktedonobacter sp. SOSP1-52]